MHKPISYTIDIKTGCFNCTSHFKDRGGYPRIMVNGKKMNMSRYIYEQYYNVRLLPKTVIMHVCDNPSCINPKHLKAGSHKDNMIDRNNKQRQAVGERNGRSKLTEVQVEEIIYSNLPKRRLSRIYGVVPKVIRQIKNGELWRHVYERVYGNTNMIDDDNNIRQKPNPHHNDSKTASKKAI